MKNGAPPSTQNLRTLRFEKNNIIWYWRCSVLAYCEIWLLRGSKAFLLLLKALYHLYIGKLAATEQRSNFDDIMFAILENISINKRPRISLLVASIEPTAISDAVCQHFRRDSRCEAPLHCIFCWDQCIMSAYETTVLQEIVFVQDKTTSIIYSGYACIMPERCCFILGM